MSNQELYKIKDEKLYKTNHMIDKLTSFFIKSKKNQIPYPKKILILRNDHIGDMVHSTQVFRELKREFPDTKITVLASNENKGIIEKNKNVDQIIIMDLFWRRKNLNAFLEYLKVLKKIKEENFDLGIDLRMSRLNTYFFLYVPKIKTRIGYSNINGGKPFLTHPVIYDKKVHVTEEPIKLINEAFNKKIINNHFPEIITDNEDEKIVKDYILNNKLKKFIVLCPGSTTSSKKWPEKNFNDLIKTFNKKYPNHKIIITSGNDDKDMIDRLCERNPKITIPLLGFNLRRLSLILKKADAIVANNNAGTGIAWVIGANLVALCDGVDLDVHRPLLKTKVIHHKLECYPCDWTKPCTKPTGVWCMDLITVDEVMQNINEFIENRH